jgi:hypothetical protein
MNHLVRQQDLLGMQSLDHTPTDTQRQKNTGLFLPATVFHASLV